jgi:16S rRNA (cytosine1407-C5)-methyltransferase
LIALSENISEYIENIFGKEFLDNYRKFVESKYPTTLRFSETEEKQSSLIDSLKRQGIELDKIEKVPNAYSVKFGDDIAGKTIEFLLGKYYIQSLSSMIPPFVLNPTKEDTVLDLCAAPGSKSTQLAELMEYKGTLYSNEPSLNRIKALVHNLDKMNAVNISVIKEKGELLSKRFPEYFDKILVDAPCSALGVVQKKQEVSNWWNSKSVDNISSLQLKLLISAIKMTKIGGEIVYSTCTLTVEENELIINKAIKKYPVELVEFDLDLPHINGFVNVKDYKFDKSLSLAKRIIPWEIKSEGFFIAKLKKTASTEKADFTYRATKTKKSIVRSNDKKIKKYLEDLTNHFGIDKSVFTKYKYLINNNDINFTNENSIDYDPNFFLRIGTKFGIIDKTDSCKINSHAAQILGKFATKNIFELKNDNELRTYFSGGVIYRSKEEKGQKIIKYRNLFLGTGVAIKNQLKSQFPRSKRTGSITI